MENKKSKTKELVEKAVSELAKKLEAEGSEAFKRFLEVSARFYNYSFRNVLLIHMQMPEAARVAGYKTWGELGRQVRKGEKSIKIIAPMPKKKETENGEETYMLFRAISVFDISQTDGEELPQLEKTSGRVGDNLERLMGLVRAKGIRLSFSKELREGVSGYATKDREIVIREGLSDAETFSVITHELAHSMLHFGELEEGGALPRLSQIELEAEAVAFVVGQAIGLKNEYASSDYIKLYKGDREQLLKSVKAIQETSREIIDYVCK